jgi:Na+/proline symporter
VLVAGTILFFVTGGPGLLGIPFLKRRWKAATIVASILSLLLFAVTWTGLLPHPSDAVFGPVISEALLVGLLVALLLEHTALQHKPHHMADRF